MKRLLFIMNPYAGKRKARRYLAEIVELFNRADYEVIAYMTAGQGDAQRFVKEYVNDVDLVVCCGGDGTFNETAAGILETGVQVPVGYIPAGSTNDFATSLKLPTVILKAAKSIVEGKARAVDMGTFNGRYFSYVASFGAFTKTSYATPQNVKNVLGHAAYILGGIHEITQIKPYRLKFELADGTVVEDDFIFGAVSNSTSVAGILTLSDKIVDMTDGQLELLLIRPPKDVRSLTECISALQKKTYDCAMITFVSTPSVKITAPENMNWTLDGELQEGSAEIQVECLQHAIRIVCPEVTEEKKK